MEAFMVFVVHLCPSFLFLLHACVVVVYVKADFRHKNRPSHCLLYISFKICNIIMETNLCSTLIYVLVCNVIVETLVVKETSVFSLILPFLLPLSLLGGLR